LYDIGMTLSLLIAGFTIKIVFLPTEWPEKKDLLINLIKRYFEPFITSNQKRVDATINIIEISGIPFINRQKIEFSQYFQKKRKNVYEMYYHISIFELSQLLLIAIINLLGKDGFLLHASSVLVKNRVVMFIGKSGAGKSTTMKMLKDSFPPFSDDCVAIKKSGNEYLCFQVPWIEKDSSLIKLSQKGLKITALFFLVKNRPFSLKKVNQLHMFHQVMLNTWTVNKASKDTLYSVAQFVNSENNIFSRILNMSKNDEENLIKEVSEL